MAFAFGYNARTAESMRTWELDLGMVGPQSCAKQSQDFIHELRGIPSCIVKQVTRPTRK
mgnify:CR=1 FL=1